MWLHETTIGRMKAVGIRELKARLSAFLRDVGAGETVFVTDRGRVVAELRPPAAAPADQTDRERRLQRLAARGDVRIGGRPDPRVYTRSPLPATPSGTAVRLLDEERGER